MGQTIELPFATQAAASSSLQNGREVLLNMFVEVETDARRRVIRRQRAALDDLAALSGEPRCIERFQDTYYLVVSYSVYSFDGTTLTLLDTITSGSGRCTMVFSDTGDILISDGATLYRVNAADPSTPTAAGHVAFLNGYGIYIVPGEQQFYVSNLNDFSTWDALNFASAETNSDDLVRAFTDHGELWLFGKQSIEIWADSGGTDFPFSPLTNAHLERGCGAAFSIARADNTIFFFGDDNIVYRIDGYRPTRVSTHTIERLIEAVPLSVRALADAVVYTFGGHKFYTLRFPDYLTIQYNIATGRWNVAGTYLYNDWRILGSAGGELDYILSASNVCRLSDSLNTDEGGILQRKAISAPIWADGKRVSLRSFFLDVEVGRAPITTTDPKVMLRYAPDGETFGNERWRSVGNTGEYTKRVIWRNVGFGRRGTVEISATDDFPLKIVGSDGNITVASS